MNCNHMGCRIYGAHRVAISIKDSAVLLHSPVSCDYATLLGLAPSHNNDIRQACTYIVERDVIYGGARNLKACINKVMETFHYNILFIITSCIPELLSDDCAPIISKLMQESLYPNAKKPTLLVESPGFHGDEWSGTLETLSQIIDLMEPKDIAPASINLIGFFQSDYKVDGDLKCIEQMLTGVTVNAVFPYDSYSRIMNVPAAQLNVVLHGFAPTGDKLKERFGTPYIELDYPYGISQSRSFVENVCSALGLNDFTKLARLEQYTLHRLQGAQYYIEQLFEMPVAVIGYPARVHSLHKLLKEELGMDTVVVVDRRSFSKDSLYDIIADSGATLLFASSYEASFAARLDIVFIEYDYPVLRRLSISENGYAGFSGYVNFIEDLINTLIERNFSEV
ncbi:nitrogenase component 1 [Lachnospiraceae bacterium ZAX-1]